MDQRIIDLYDVYTHGGLSRRAFLDKLASLAGSAAAATAPLPLLTNAYPPGPPAPRRPEPPRVSRQARFAGRQRRGRDRAAAAPHERLRPGSDRPGERLPHR